MNYFNYKIKRSPVISKVWKPVIPFFFNLLCFLQIIVFPWELQPRARNTLGQQLLSDFARKTHLQTLSWCFTFANFSPTDETARKSFSRVHQVQSLKYPSDNSMENNSEKIHKDKCIIYPFQLPVWKQSKNFFKKLLK